MRMPHTRYHWLAVALVLIALLLALNEAHGQGSGAAAAFEGRPAMAGAQAGLGAQAGPPQGGIGAQGSEAAGRELPLRRPGAKDGMPLAAADSGIVPGKDPLKPKDAKEVAKPKDTGVAREERSAVKKGSRAVKRTVKRSRTGVGEIDTRRGEGG